MQFVPGVRGIDWIEMRSQKKGFLAVNDQEAKKPTVIGSIADYLGPLNKMLNNT